MLTDVVYAKADRRGYIMTADRDEHIRISRGPPQAHIIEGFCFGHEAFVSRLCLTQSGLLVSGGGDDHLLVWDWQNYLLKEKLAIRDLAFTHLQERGMIPAGVNVATYKVAVSGIWNLPSKDGVSIMKTLTLFLHHLTVDRPRQLLWHARGYQRCSASD